MILGMDVDLYIYLDFQITSPKKNRQTLCFSLEFTSCKYINQQQKQQQNQRQAAVDA